MGVGGQVQLLFELKNVFLELSGINYIKFLLFFLQIIGTLLAYRFRNLPNPRLTPPGNVYNPPSATILS